MTYTSLSGEHILIRAIVVTIAILVLLSTAPPQRVSAAGAPYNINVILSATGPGAFLGAVQVQGLGLLEQETNQAGGIAGRPIHFVISDDGTSPQAAVQLASGLIAQHVPVILGSTLSASCKAMAPLMTNTVEYCFSPAIDPTPGGNVFSAMIATPDLFRASVRYARLHGFTRIATITPTDATGQDGDRAMATAMSAPENASMKLVAAEHFAPGDLTITAQVAQLRTADSQFIIAWASGTSISTVLRGITDAGITAPVLTSTANETFAQMEALQSVLPKGGLLFPATELARYDLLRPGPLKAAQTKYLEAFKKINRVAQPSAQTAWDPASVIIDTLKHVGVNASAQQIHNYIEKIHDFAGVIGIYNYTDGSQRGIGLNSVVVEQWSPKKKDWFAVSSSGGIRLP